MLQNTMKQNLPKLLSMSAEFTASCQPLIDKLGLSFMRITRHYADGSFALLTNNPDSVDWYFREKMYELGINEDSSSGFKKGFILTNTLENPDDVHTNLVNPLTETFNVASELCLYEPQKTHCDIYEVGMPAIQHQANTILMTNYDYIHRYFNKHIVGGDLLKKAEAHRFKLPAESKISEENKLGERVIGTDLATAIHKLSRRELEVMFWLRLGKSVPVIAQVIGLQSSTVETYVKNLKLKLGYAGLVQIGEVIGRNHRHFNALFDELVS